MLNCHSMLRVTRQTVLTLTAVVWLTASVTADVADETSKEPPSTIELNPDEYYQLFGMLADAIAQVEANYVKPIERRILFEHTQSVISKFRPIITVEKVRRKRHAE